MGPCASPPQRAGTAPAAIAAPVMVERSSPTPGEGWSVVWARGAGCPDLAGLLGGDAAQRVGPDLRASCIEARADLLVARRLTSFDLVPVAVPYGFDPGEVCAVVGAIAGGPHSLLAARIAERLAAVLDVSVSLVAASADTATDDLAEQALERAAAAVPVPERRVVRAANPGLAVRALPPGSLLVLGAPGGTWWRRQFSGPGRQLRLGAPAGAVVVRSAPRRCFHEMGEPAAMGAQMPAAEALRLTADGAVPVAEDGRLIGIVRRRALEAAAPAATLGSLMEDPTFALVDDPLDAAAQLFAFLDGAPVPVVDGARRLCGLLALSSPGPLG